MSWWGAAPAAAAAAVAAAAAGLPLRALAHASHAEGEEQYHVHRLLQQDPLQRQQQQQHDVGEEQQHEFPVWASKLFAVCVLTAVSAGGAVLPFYLQRKAAANSQQQQQQGGRRNCSRKRTWIQVMLVFLNCFACGMPLCFLLLLLQQLLLLCLFSLVLSSL